MTIASYHYYPFVIAPNGAFPTGRTVQRPLALATITGSNGRFFQWIVLPDSGADACLFPLSLAKELKLDIASMPKAQTVGVGGHSNTTYYDNLMIDMGQGIAFSAYVGFTQGMEAVGTGLLGQYGFFDRYNVEFRHEDRIFTVETRSP